MQAPAARHAVLTGATGFIGWHLASWLRDQGWHVRALLRPESRGEVPPGVERVVTHMRAEEIARRVPPGSVAFHCAGRTSAATRRQFDATNVDLTREVAAAARDAGARLVHVSSQAAAGPAPLALPRTEDDEESPCSPYGASKLASERVVSRTQGLAWSIVRPVAVYGPRDRAFLPLFKLARAGCLPTFGDPAASYMLIHVADLMYALEQAAMRDEAIGEICFVGHAEPCRTDVVLEALARAVGRRARKVAVARPLLHAAALCGDLASLAGGSLSLDRSKLAELSAGGFACSVARAARVLGSSPTIDLDAGFAATAAWYRQEGLLRP